VSTTLKNPEWTNVTVLDSGDATAQVAKLKDEIDGTILLAGSRRLVQELLGSDLVDQINLMIFPVVLGTGDRMFGEMNDKTTWKLVESRQVGPDGVLVQSYERA
jgi:dihydrofolate reductase